MLVRAFVVFKQVVTCLATRQRILSIGSTPACDIHRELILLYIRFPKLFPLLETFISKGGNFYFQGRKTKFPTEELLGERVLGRGLQVSKWK